MPAQRIKQAAWPLTNRIVYYAWRAPLLGLATSFLAEFALKFYDPEVLTFAHLVAYADQLWLMFQKPTRLYVCVSAALLFALAQATLIYALQHEKELSSKRAGLEDLDLDFKARAIRLPKRAWHWIIVMIEKIATTWLMYLMYFTFDPNQQISWLRFRRFVLNPFEVLSGPEALLVFFTLVVLGAVATSAYGTAFRPHHDRFKKRGNVKK